MLNQLRTDATGQQDPGAKCFMDEARQLLCVIRALENAVASAGREVDKACLRVEIMRKEDELVKITETFIKQPNPREGHMP